MIKRLIVLLALAATAACATNVKTTSNTFEPPTTPQRILLVEPDVQVSLLTAGGLAEPRADWTDTARENVAARIEEILSPRNHEFIDIDPADVEDPRVSQLLRLHESVGQSIILYEYMGQQLPTKTDTFDWTLGEGARTLADVYDADFALFTYASGAYSSGGRIAVVVVLAALGSYVPTGSQTAFASLVDLRTGDIVWFNVVGEASAGDMREEDGAKGLVSQLLADIPL